jgi:hypothetical protein
MPAKKAAKKAVAKKAPAKKAVAKKAPAKKAAVKAAPKKPKAAAKTVPTLGQLQEAAYFNYLKRTSEGLPGDSSTDWAAAMKQLGA